MQENNNIQENNGQQKSPWCCYVDEEGSGCQEEPIWEIFYETSDPYDYSHSCTKHIVDLLEKDVYHHIYPLEWRTEVDTGN